MNPLEKGFVEGVLSLEKTAAGPASRKALEAAQAAAKKAGGKAAGAAKGAVKASPEALKKLIEMAKRHPYLAGGLGGYAAARATE